MGNSRRRWGKVMALAPASARIVDNRQSPGLSRQRHSMMNAPPGRDSAHSRVAETLALLGEPFEQWRGRPRLAVARVEARHVGEHLLEPDLIGVEHGATTIAREPVAVEVRDVDVARPQRDAFLEDARALVDEGPQAALQDLVVADLPPFDPALLGAGGDERLHLGIGLGRTAARLVAVPPRARLLAEAPLLAEAITHVRVAEILAPRGRLALADPPAHVEAGQVLHGEGPHGEAEVVDDLVDLLGRGSLLHEEFRLAEIGRQHAVAYEAVAIAREHPHLADAPGELGGGGDGLLRGLGPA